MQPRASLNAYFQDAVRDNWERPALTDFNGMSFHYKDVARKIAKLHLLFEKSGIKKETRLLYAAKTPHSGAWHSLPS